MRKCNRCQSVQSVGEFIGTSPHCRLCRNALKREYRALDPEKSRNANRLSYGRHRERRCADARFQYQHNPERFKTQARRWIKENPAKRSSIMCRQNAKRRARMYKNGYETVTQSQWNLILEMTGNRCMYCHSNDSLAMDHFYPISRGGAHTAINVLPACKSCNSSKWNYDPETWITKVFGKERFIEVQETVDLIKRALQNG